MDKNNISSSSVFAVDLGSNSFHLLQACLDRHGRLQRLSSRRQKVQLALDMRDGVLADAAWQRASVCLASFAEGIQDHPGGSVRIVGTQALRQALPAQQQAFAELVLSTLGHPLEIIAGELEAALVYRAVAHNLAAAGPMFVIDVGGGSVELAVGEGAELHQSVSVPVGCVSLLPHFTAGIITPATFDAACQVAQDLLRQALHGVDTGLLRSGARVVGCSGTLLALEQVLRHEGWSMQGIRRDHLWQLRQQLLAFNHIDSVQFQGLREDRRSVFATGLAVGLALFEVLHIDTMTLCNAALREGVALSLLHN